MLSNRFLKLFRKPFVTAMAIATCTITGHAMVATAQGLPGITYRWDNREGFNELGYAIDLSNAPGRWGRYRLKIGARDMKLAASQFTINIPENFDGVFNEEEVEVRVCSRPGTFLRRAKCDAIAVDDVAIDREAGQIAIYPQVPVEAGKNIELVFDDVKNPRDAGFYQFNALVEVPGDIPILRPLGSWILTFERN